MMISRTHSHSSSGRHSSPAGDTSSLSATTPPLKPASCPIWHMKPGVPKYLRKVKTSTVPVQARCSMCLLKSTAKTAISDRKARLRNSPSDTADPLVHSPQWEPLKWVYPKTNSCPLWMPGVPPTQTSCSSGGMLTMP